MTDHSSSSVKTSQQQPQPPQSQPQSQQQSSRGRSQGSRGHGRRSEQNRGSGRGGGHDGTSKSLLQPPTMIPMEFTMPPTSPVSPAAAAVSEPQPQTLVMQQFTGKASKPRIPTWLTKVRSSLPVSLHQEIILFFELMKATPEEERMRKDLVTRLTSLISKLWPAAKTTLYGSCLTGTCLPMSDVDIVVSVDTPYPPLQVLADALRRNFPFEAMELLTTARVPLIKLCDSTTKLVVDISFNQNTGPHNSEAVLELMKKYPETKPLVFVLKYLLYWHAMNEVYSGGLGSYALTLMIVSYIQKHSDSVKRVPAQDGGEDQADLGQLLLGFLHFYGFEFDYETQGISVLEDGSYFSKQERGWFIVDKPYLLALEDPCDTENDVGKSAFNITGVTMLFRQAYDQLILPERYSHVSFLSRVMDVPQRMLTVRRSVSAPFKTKSSKKYRKRRDAKQAQNGESTATTTTTTTAAAATTATPSLNNDKEIESKDDSAAADSPSDEDSSDPSSLRSSKGDSGNESSQGEEKNVISDSTS